MESPRGIGATPRRWSIKAAPARTREYGAGGWRGGPWPAAVAEARAELLLAEGDDYAAADALRRAAEGYAAAGQLLNERRPREALARIDGATVHAWEGLGKACRRRCRHAHEHHIEAPRSVKPEEPRPAHPLGEASTTRRTASTA